jgi:hypothetical protein
MSKTEAHEALLAAANAALTGIPTEYQNLPFTKPVSSKWAQVHFMPNQPHVETLGLQGEDFVDGILQISINYPRNTGDIEARADYEEINSAFLAGRKYTYNGQPVAIRSCGCSSGYLEEQWYRIVITIQWWTLVPR